MSYALPLLLFLIPLAYSPGPGNLFFAALSARFGAASTLHALNGYHVATLIVTLIIGFGFELGTGDNATLTKFLTSAGALYVLFLAYKLATSKAPSGPLVGRVAGFLDGFLLLVFNPKAYLIIALLFTQFSPAKLFPENPILGSVLIAVAFTIHNLIAFTVWIVASDKVGSGFRSKQNIQGMNWIFGGMLGIVAIWMFVANWV